MLFLEILFRTIYAFQVWKTVRIYLCDKVDIPRNQIKCLGRRPHLGRNGRRPPKFEESFIYLALVRNFSEILFWSILAFQVWRTIRIYFCDKVDIPRNQIKCLGRRPCLGRNGRRPPKLEESFIFLLGTCWHFLENNQRYDSFHFNLHIRVSDTVYVYMFYVHLPQLPVSISMSMCMLTGESC